MVVITAGRRQRDGLDGGPKLRLRIGLAVLRQEKTVVIRLAGISAAEGIRMVVAQGEPGVGVGQCRDSSRRQWIGKGGRGGVE